MNHKKPSIKILNCWIDCIHQKESLLERKLVVTGHTLDAWRAILIEAITYFRLSAHKDIAEVVSSCYICTQCTKVLESRVYST